MSDYFLECDAELASPALIAIPPQTFDEGAYGEIIVGSPDDELVTAENNDMGEVIVIGPSADGFWFGYESYGEPLNYDHTSIEPPQDPVPTYYDFMQQACLADLAVDMIARQIEALIKAQSDWNAREYGAVIYMVGNEVKMGPLLRGTTLAEAQSQGRDSAYTDFYLPADIGDGVVLAFVHSHPSVGYGTDYVPGRYPSDKVASGDYFGVEQLVLSHAQFGNNAAFAQYILGPDGILREFNFSEGRITKDNDPDPESRSNLMKDRPCRPD